MTCDPAAQGVGPTFDLCCVIDAHPRFHVESVLWATCAIRSLPADRFHLIAYLVGALPDDLVDWLVSHGVETRTTEPVVPGSPHSNKIAPFLDVHAADWVMVTDADLYIVEDPSPLFGAPRFRAPPNNHSVPPSHILRDVLAATGLPRPFRPGIALYPGVDGLRETHINNINGGCIAAPSDRAQLLGSAWRRWADWLVARRALLDRWPGHVDQVAFALALEELGEDVEHLPPQANTILHSLQDYATSYAFHLSSGHIPDFPRRFHEDRTLRTDDLAPGMRDAVARLNDCIRDAARVIKSLPSTRDHLDKFLNPAWVR
jgi:hypothetical protein